MGYICIKQHDSNDCGAACLSTICAFYGLYLPLYRYKELAKTDNNGTNIYGIIDAASQLGLSGKALNGDFSELLEGISDKEINVPFIAQVINENKQEHYIVVHKITHDFLIVADPAKGIRKYSFEEFCSCWVGNIIVLSKNDQFVKKKSKNNLLLSFLRLVGNQKKIVLAVIGCSVIISAIGILGAFTFQYMIDIVTTTDSNLESVIDDYFRNNDIQHILMMICGLVVLLYILESILKIIRGYLLSYFSNKLDVSIMLSYYNRVIDLPMYFFGTRKSGEIMSRFSDAASIREIITNVIFTSVIDLVMVLFGGVILYYISPILFGWIVLISISYLIIMFGYKNRIKVIERNIMEANAQVTSFLKETIEGIETIKSFHYENKVKEKSHSLFNKMLEKVFGGNIMDNNKNVLVEFISSVGTIIMFCIGVLEVFKGNITVGNLISFNALSIYFLNPLINLIGLQTKIQSAVVAADRLSDMMMLESEKLDNGIDLPDLKRDITIKNIYFRYGNRELVLENICLNIKRGQKIGIVGESGSGKTSLSKLITALYTPESGEILFDDTPISQINTGLIRNKVSYLSQDIFFFADTIKNNLKIGNIGATDEEIENVCKKCFIHEYIDNLPYKYDTLLEENGNNLSGGQKQMLALARALLKKPDIIILDEATSNLDSSTEKNIEKVISFLIQEKVTCILIAHRLRTVTDCDNIYVLDKGRMAEHGTHEYLLESRKKYYKLWSDYSNHK